MSDSYEDQHINWMSTYEILAVIIELVFTPTKYPNHIVPTSINTQVSYKDLRHLVRHLKQRFTAEELEAIRDTMRTVAKGHLNHE